MNPTNHSFYYALLSFFLYSLLVPLPVAWGRPSYCKKKGGDPLGKLESSCAVILATQKVRVYGKGESPSTTYEEKTFVKEAFKARWFYGLRPKEGEGDRKKTFLVQRKFLPNEEILSDIGWVDSKYLLFKDKNQDVVLPEKKDGVLKKVIVINPIEKNPSASTVKQAYCSPSTRKICNQVPAFQFFFLYKELGGSYLIGTKTSIGNQHEQTDNTGLLGWLKKTEGQQWNTRIALQIYKKNLEERTRPSKSPMTQQDHDPKKLVYVYSTHEKAKKSHIKYALTKENFKIKRWPHDWLRWPLLESLPKSRDLTNAPVMLEHPYHNYFFKVGVFGQNVQEILQAYKSIDVVFVIDTTNSMQPYIDAAKNTMVDILEDFKRPDRNKASIWENVTFRFGLVAYRNYAHANNNNSYVYSVKKKLGKPSEYHNEMAQLKEALDKTKAWSSTIGEWHESVTLGIQEAIKNTGFSHTSRSSAKVIVLIGDHGSLEGKKGGFYHPSISEIKKMLEENFIFFCALQVKTKTTVSAWKTFTKQFTDLVESASYASCASSQKNETCQMKNKAMGAFFQTIENKSLVKKSLLYFFTKMAEWIEKRRKYIEDVAGGRVQTLEEVPSAPSIKLPVQRFLAQELKMILKEKNMTLNELQNQIYYSTGYVSLYHPQSKHLQVEPMALITFDELALLVAEIAKIKDGIEKKQDDLPCRIYFSLLGEQYHKEKCPSFKENLSISDLFKKRGLPLYTDLLSVSFSNLKTTKQRRCLVKKLSVTINIWRLIIRSSKIPPELIRLKNKRGCIEEAVPFINSKETKQYRFDQNANVETSFLWLPLSYF